MENEVIKTLELDGNSYTIGRFSSDTGSWLLMRLMKTLRKFISELEQDGIEESETDIEPEGFAENLIQTLLTDLDFDDFKNIQRHALAVVSRIDYAGEREFQQPIVMRSGAFAFNDLSQNVGIVMALTSQSLFANLSPFFTKTGLKALMKGEIAFSR